jgi:ribosome-binding protein aMBF1 (putative translation factor)
MHIGQVVRQYREATHKSRDTLARELKHWTPYKLKHLESGTTSPGAVELQELVDLLEIPANRVTLALRMGAP